MMVLLAHGLELTQSKQEINIPYGTGIAQILSYASHFPDCPDRGHSLKCDP